VLKRSGGVVAGLVPATSTTLAWCPVDRGRRDKPGDDAMRSIKPREIGFNSLIQHQCLSVFLS
jgi:hypothetical protein